jgi:uncharacterized SAM-dependent methyltransferase
VDEARRRTLALIESVSAKFTRDAVQGEFAGAGLRLDDFFTDERGLFGLALAPQGPS